MVFTKRALFSRIINMFFVMASAAFVGIIDCSFTLVSLIVSDNVVVVMMK